MDLYLVRGGNMFVDRDSLNRNNKIDKQQHIKTPFYKMTIPPFLLPHRVWVRILSWIPLFSMMYALLLTMICLIADAMDPPPPDAMFWLPAGFFVAVRGVVLSPLALLVVWLASIFCPHRTPMSRADYIALTISLTLIIFWGTYVWLFISSDGQL